MPNHITESKLGSSGNVLVLSGHFILFDDRDKYRYYEAMLNIDLG